MTDYRHPRPRAEIEADIDRMRAERGPAVDSQPVFELEWEYFERLQRDGVLRMLPRVVVPAASDHKNDNDEGEEDDGRPDDEFEVGEKG